MPSSTTINTIGQPFVQLKTVESTNTYAMQMLQQGFVQHGHTVFTHAQTAGKGQRGKVWSTEPDSNIIVSIVLDVSFLSLNQQFFLSATVAVAVHDFFSSYAGDESKIKWPNDIYWQNRKAGGILIENIVRGAEWNWAVVGIGLNVNQASFPKHLLNPVSLKQITGKSFDVVELTKALCSCLEKRYKELKNNKAKKLLDTYNKHLYKLHSDVKLKKRNIVFPCTIEGVSNTGELLVKSNLYNEFNFGEVEWVLT